MDLTRIANAVDVEGLKYSTVTVVGAGGSAGLISDLARCGIGNFNLVDPDRIEAANVVRQAHGADQVGMPKVKAVAKRVEQINPDAHVRYLAADFCALTDEMIDQQFGDTDLFVFATDRFAAQARGNEVALRLGKSALWIGLYRGAGAGEIAFWHRDIDACFRCLFAKRYEQQERARREGRSLDPPSDGATIFDIHYLDSIAGMVALGLLTRGADNRFGRLIGQLGDRNFIQVKIAPEYRWNGRDVIREQLGVTEDCDAFFAWNTIVRRDPDGGALYCPDCERFRGHTFSVVEEMAIRIKNSEISALEDSPSTDVAEQTEQEALEI